MGINCIFVAPNDTAHSGSYGKRHMRQLKLGENLLGENYLDQRNLLRVRATLSKEQLHDYL